MTTLAKVVLWGSTIGAVSLEDGQEVAAFQYDEGFAASGIQVSPLSMPLRTRTYAFSALPKKTFHGLPGLLADALPDRFGNDLINAWLATQGRSPESFNAVERLCYTGNRGMGALEFVPTSGPNHGGSLAIDVAALVALAADVLRNRHDLRASFANPDRAQALTDILRVGTSAGGARPKALIAWNEATNEVRSGQTTAGEGFGYWLLKFDGIEGDTDRDLTHGRGFGAIEYAYSRMAQAAGIRMTECRLFAEGGRRHFMTKRFDRRDGGEKLHVQTLGSLAHLDFNAAGANSYEQAFLTIRQLGLEMNDVEQLFRRMVFNVLARNQDDHVKNIAFLMDKRGQWSLSPAYDVCYSYNPTGLWTARHQMTINGKRDDFSRADLRACGVTTMLKPRRANALIDEVRAAVENWPDYAHQAGVSTAEADTIYSHLRLHI